MIQRGATTTKRDDDVLEPSDLSVTIDTLPSRMSLLRYNASIGEDDGHEASALLMPHSSKITTKSRSFLNKKGYLNS